MEADRLVENQVRRVPPSLLVGLALGSMALSAAFAVAGKLKVEAVPQPPGRCNDTDPMWIGSTG